jgi:hypothetical protein
MLDSSPASAADTSAVVDTTNSAADVAANTTSDATTAASSTADEKPAGTMLDAVKAAIAPKGESPAPKSTDAPADGDPASKAEDDTDDEMSPEEIKALTARTQRRFTKLTKSLKAQSAEIESLKPKAAEFDKIDTFVRNAGLSPEDVAGTLEIAAMLRSPRPQDALARLMPIVAKLQEMSGETLPADLQTRVDQGYLTEADAKTLAKAQAEAKLATTHVTQLTERQRADQQRSEHQALVSSTVSSAEAWEAKKAERDPDWHLKRDQVAELVELAIERKTREVGRPWFPNSEETIKLSEDALKTVTERFKRFSPKAQEIRPVLNGGASPRSTAAPKNMLDVVRQSVGA